MPLSRGEWYRILLKHLDLAIEAGFPLEAIWLAYAILEDRCDSLLAMIEVDRPDQPTGLGRKLAEIERFARTDVTLRGALMDGQLTAEIRRWAKRRNALAHELARHTRQWDELVTIASAIATDGRGVARSAADATTRLRKRRRRSKK